jgi:N-acetylmuramoyl-L-alanine amidase
MKGTMAKRKQTNFIVIHSTGTPPDMDIDLRTIDEWHRKRGWLKIGYHFFIGKNGTIEIGRNADEVGAHTKGYNGNSVSVVMVGGTDKSGNPDPYFSASQWEALFSLVNSLTFMYRDAKVVGHGDLIIDSDCPGFSVKRWWINNSELIYGKTGYNNE